MGRWIKLTKICDDEELTPDDRLRLVAASMGEWAIATSLKTIHGDYWVQRYIDTGGTVRFADREPVIWSEAKERM